MNINILLQIKKCSHLYQFARKRFGINFILCFILFMNRIANWRVAPKEKGLVSIRAKVGKRKLVLAFIRHYKGPNETILEELNPTKWLFI